MPIFWHRSAIGLLIQKCCSKMPELRMRKLWHGTRTDLSPAARTDGYLDGPSKSINIVWSYHDRYWSTWTGHASTRQSVPLEIHVDPCMFRAAALWFSKWQYSGGKKSDKQSQIWEQNVYTFVSFLKQFLWKPIAMALGILWSSLLWMTRPWTWDFDLSWTLRFELNCVCILLSVCEIIISWKWT